MTVACLVYMLKINKRNKRMKHRSCNFARILRTIIYYKLQSTAYRPCGFLASKLYPTNQELEVILDISTSEKALNTNEGKTDSLSIEQLLVLTF